MAELTLVEQYAQILQSTVEQVTKDIADAQGLNCDFVVSVTPNLDAVYAIRAGYPPTLIVNSNFVLNLILAKDAKEAKKAPAKLRRAMASAISKIPRMQRTLALVPIAEAIAMRDGMKQWVKTNRPDKLIYSIPDSHIVIEEVYTITMREITTDTSVTLSGPNPTRLRSQCKERLTNLVAMNEHLAQKLKDESFVPEIKPVELVVNINPNTEYEEVEYKYNES